MRNDNRNSECFENAIKKIILEKYRKVSGAVLSRDRRRIDIPLPAEHGDTEGRLTTIFPGGPILLNLIDIRTREIPVNIASPKKNKNVYRVLKINYCIAGRCELRLCSGECTYLAAGEIAVDAGQALSAFYYPSGEYRGFEIVVYPDFLPRKCEVFGECLSSPERIYEQCSDFEHPWIRSSDESVSGMYERLRLCTDKYDNSELTLLLCLEAFSLLSHMDFSKEVTRRTYCTASQAEIAKRTREKIMSDLSVRYTARELAKSFGVSETSLKNYFRSVYGCGYAEYQQTVRMEKAARLLEETEDKVAVIGQAVGFATQAKFGAAFKEFFGVTPLEYRRGKKLKTAHTGRYVGI
ncbi:MAG: AraC family transcriptional regulator [Lachnospiraceae bacterium]|nr:AraC family transcriptional regulator [Lachnospiraceae bacterium]